MLERLVRALPAIAWMAFIFAMSSREQFPQSFGVSASMLAIVAHMVLYGILATLLLLIVDRNGSASWSTMLAAIAGAALYGVSDEFHQSFVPGRDASIFDVVVNTIGATIAVVAWPHLRSILTAVTSR